LGSGGGPAGAAGESGAPSSGGSSSGGSSSGGAGSGGANTASGGGGNGGSSGEAPEPPWQQQAELPESGAEVQDFATGDVSLHDGIAELGSDVGDVHVFAQTANGWVEEPLLLSSDTSGQDFGGSVSVFGDTLLVGAAQDGAGSVYVFERDDGSWNEVGRLRPSAGTEGDGCAWKLALSGATALVGCWNGGATMFEREGTEWNEAQQLVSTEAGAVALDGDTAVIAPDLQDQVGAAQVFVRDAAGWELEQELVPDVVEDPSYMTLALSGDTLLMGVQNDRDSAGAVHVFSREGREWRETQLLLGADGEANMGRAVAIDRDVALAVAWDDYSGIVHAYERATTWNQVQSLVSPRSPLDSFGRSISVFGDTALIAAPGMGELDDWAGSAYLFTHVSQP